LPDGSRVWLNSASSLKFPTAFTGSERDVELIGEGYFEVARNKAKPFNVKVKDINVAVLGTHFNIMAYNDEAAVKTTLLEGLVRLTHGNVTDMLKPGQQGVINDKGIKIIDVDTDEAVAWKNGFFEFDRVSIQDIMKQLSRWYGTEVTYEGKIPDDEFVGKISRDVKLSQVLHILELSHVRFRIENKKIIVTP
jgi:ferric-dicitrate binding protein FerR (iron transport regulator)